MLRALSLLLALTATATAQTVYVNDFAAGGDVAGWSTPTITAPAWQAPIGIGRSPIDSTFLGEFGNQSVSFTIAGAPRHDSVVVELDLYIIRTWDGSSGTSDGPDIFTVTDDALGQLLRTTFSNNDGLPQAYPGAHPGASNPPMTGAVAISSLGYAEGDAVYRLRLIYPHTSPTIALTFEAQLRDRFERLGNESWGIDNVVISVLPARPASATIAAGEITGAPGDRVLLPIFIRDAVSLISSGATRVRTTIRFNGSMLMPVMPTPLGRIENGERIIDIELPLAIGIDSSIGRLTFGVVLGNDTLTPITLEASSMLDGEVLLREQAGVFRTKGLCEDGGARLFVEQPAVLLRAPYPNPARDRVTIAFELAAESAVRLELVEATGRVAAVLVDGSTAAGAHAMTIEAPPAGRYVLRLVAGRELEEREMVVVR